MSTRTYFSLGNRTMAVSSLALLVSAGAAYPFAQHFGLALQILAHLTITVAAGFFKLGYVIRLAAQHEHPGTGEPGREARVALAMGTTA